MNKVRSLEVRRPLIETRIKHPANIKRKKSRQRNGTSSQLVFKVRSKNLGF